MGRARLAWIAVAISACGGKASRESRAEGTGVQPPIGGMGGAAFGGQAAGGSAAGAATGGGPSAACVDAEAPASLGYVTEQADLAGLRGYTTLGGHLRVTGEVIDLSDLTCLTRVKGELRVYETTALTDLSGLENLRTVDGTVFIGRGCQKEVETDCKGNLALASVVLPSLEEATHVDITGDCFGEGGDYCTENVALQAVELNGLKDLGELRIARNPLLTEVHVDNLVHAVEVNLSSNENLATAEFGSLVDVISTVFLHDLPNLGTLRGFAALESASNISLGQTGVSDLSGLGSFKTGALGIAANPALVSVDGLSMEVVGGLDIVINPVLADLRGLGSVRSVDDRVVIADNPKLPTCEATWLIETIGTSNIGNYVRIEGNDDQGVCPP